MDADTIAAILKIKEDLLAELSLGKNENTFSFLPQSKRSIRTYTGTMSQKAMELVPLPNFMFARVFFLF